MFSEVFLKLNSPPEKKYPEEEISQSKLYKALLIICYLLYQQIEMTQIANYRDLAKQTVSFFLIYFSTFSYDMVMKSDNF